MYTIQANQSGTKRINVSHENLETIQEYNLFNRLIDSNGLITEDVLNKLRLNLRSIIANQEKDNKRLLNLSVDVIYHKYMKAYGLQELIKLYISWIKEEDEEQEKEE